MANTYTQIHIQSVFAVKYRAALLDKSWRRRLFQYMIGIMNHLGHKTLAVNGVEDHIHLLYGLRPEKSISESMRMLKGETSAWINENRFCKGRFEWQNGYGAFSYRKRDVPTIATYIENQEEHHRKVVFIDEYRGLLKEFGVEFDERYILLPPG
jgi:REP element-mobilizing transposase RayT